MTNFELFESQLQRKGYSIACLNHYHQNGKHYTFCVVHNPKTKQAFKSESEYSENVFFDILLEIDEFLHSTKKERKEC